MVVSSVDSGPRRIAPSEPHDTERSWLPMLNQCSTPNCSWLAMARGLCHTCYCRDYTERNKEKERQRKRAYGIARRAHNPDYSKTRAVAYPIQTAARRILRNAVRGGRLQKAQQCQGCGSASLLHGHHADHSQPLNIEWLCSVCHGQRHRTGACSVRNECRV